MNLNSRWLVELSVNSAAIAKRWHASVVIKLGHLGFPNSCTFSVWFSLVVCYRVRESRRQIRSIFITSFHVSFCQKGQMPIYIGLLVWFCRNSFALFHYNSQQMQAHACGNRNVYWPRDMCSILLISSRVTWFLWLILSLIILVRTLKCSILGDIYCPIWSIDVTAGFRSVPGVSKPAEDATRICVVRFVGSIAIFNTKR